MATDTGGGGAATCEAGGICSESHESARQMSSRESEAPEEANEDMLHPPTAAEMRYEAEGRGMNDEKFRGEGKEWP